MGLIRRLILGGAAALVLAMPAIAADKAIIILDASGSMWAQVDGKSRIEIARETLQEVLKGAPPDLELGLMAYGHREKGNCDDIQMMVEPGLGTSQAIMDAANSISPKGKTPLSAAVRMAAEDLKYTEEKATVILITDGLETCNVDPCALGTELEAKGVDFTADVVGFGLTAEEGKQVSCLADNTGGQYFSATDGASLVKALTTTVAETVAPAPAPAPKPEPVPEPVAAPEFNLMPTLALSDDTPDLQGEHYNIVWEWYRVNPDGSKGEQVDTGYYSTFKANLPPGSYFLDVTVGYATAEQQITVKAGKVSKPHFVLNAGILKLHPKTKEGGDVDSGASLELLHDENSLTTFYGDVDTIAPAGNLTANVQIGQSKLTNTYQLKAGTTIDQDVIVGVGVVNFSAEYVEGMAIDDDIYLEIFDAKKDIKGDRKSITYGYGGTQKFQLPPADYVVAYSLDGTKGEIPFTVKADQSLDIPVVIDAGVVAITTPGDDEVEILSGKADIKGNRVSFDYGYGPTWSTTLKAGDYVIRSRDKDTPLTVPAGERTEVTIP